MLMPTSFVVCADLSPPHILPRDDDDDAYIQPVCLSTRTFFIQRSGIVNIEAAFQEQLLLCFGVRLGRHESVGLGYARWKPP
jgi:hypothetical protein